MMKNRNPKETKSMLTLLATVCVVIGLTLSLSGCGSIARTVVENKEKLFPMPVPEALEQNLEAAQGLDADDIRLITVIRATEGGVDSYYINNKTEIATYLGLIDNLTLTRATKYSVEDDGVAIYIHKGTNQIKLNFEGDSLTNGKEGALCEGLSALKARVDADTKIKN